MAVDDRSRSLARSSATKQEMLATKGLFGVKGLRIFVFVRSGDFLKGRDFDGRIAPQTC
jgi:hypothetical protein